MVEHALHAPIHHVVIEHGATVSAAPAGSVKQRMFAVLGADMDTSRSGVVLTVPWSHLIHGDMVRGGLER